MLQYFSLVVLQNFPNSADEYAYLFQAKTFLEGRLWNETHPKKEFFEFGHISQRDGKWVGKYQPGWPFILAALMFLKIPSWLINPLLATFSLLIIYLLGTYLFNRHIAFLAVVSVLFSPFFIFNSASYFSHTSCALMILLAYYFSVCLTRKESSSVYVWLVGFFIGFAFIIRQYTAILCAVPLFTYIWVIRREKMLSKDILFIFLGVLPFSAIYFWYNYQITGNIFLTPFHWHDPYDTLRFDLQILISAFKDFFMQFKWMNPVILLFYFYFLIKDLIRKKHLELHSVFALLIFSAIFYPLVCNYYGARYYYEGYALCVLFVVGKIFNDEWFKQSKLVRTLLILFFFTGFLYNVSMVPYFALKFHNQITKRKEVYNLVNKQHLTNAVVFIEDEGGQCLWMN